MSKLLILEFYACCLVSMFVSSCKTKGKMLNLEILRGSTTVEKVTLVQNFYKLRPFCIKSYTWTSIALRLVWPYDLFQASL